MIKWGLFLCAFIFIFAQTALAETMPFSDTVDWAIQSKDGRTAVKIFAPTSFTYQHSILFDPQALEITDATLTLSHYGNKYTKEAWLLFNDNSVQIGVLTNSDNVWVDQEFILDESLWDTIFGPNWVLELMLIEGSGDDNRDNIYLDKSVLDGNYVLDSPVVTGAPAHTPEPCTMLLLGAGIVGYAGTRIRKRFKK